MFRREALRAVQEEDRRTLAGLVHLKPDAGDRNDLSLQGTPPPACWFTVAALASSVTPPAQWRDSLSEEVST